MMHPVMDRKAGEVRRDINRTEFLKKQAGKRYEKDV